MRRDGKQQVVLLCLATDACARRVALLKVFRRPFVRLASPS